MSGRPVKVSTKRDWYVLQRAKVFNTTQNFSVPDFLKEEGKYSAEKIFCFRTQRAGGGAFVCMPKTEAVKQARAGKWKDSIVSEQAPDDAIQVQGEYNGTWARVTFVKRPMRFAFQESSEEISRMQLLGLIGRESYQQLEDIITTFNPTDCLDKNPVVEFSLYSKPVGLFSEHLIIWEVRNY